MGERGLIRQSNSGGSSSGSCALFTVGWFAFPFLSCRALDYAASPVGSDESLKTTGVLSPTTVFFRRFGVPLF